MSGEGADFPRRLADPGGTVVRFGFPRYTALAHVRHRAASRSGRPVRGEEGED